LHATGIEAPNVFFEILFGGKVLHPVPSLGSIVTSLVVVLAIGVVASLYPVRIALKIPPAQAMQERWSMWGVVRIAFRNTRRQARRSEIGRASCRARVWIAA